MTGATILGVHISVTESNRDLVQTNDSADLLGVQDESIAIWIEGRATPFRAAIVCRVDERASKGRWRPRTLIEILDHVVHKVDSVLVSRGDLKSLAGKGHGRNWLRPGGHFTGQVARKRLHFFDFVQRFSCITVEYEQVARFCCYRDGIDYRAIAFELHQSGR
ncbi:MAG: hypothetical protein CME12_06030 [Gemmatimonadetes bacterium]|nr:hypothetical protein [Gemmatimonadota bacterium]